MPTINEDGLINIEPKNEDGSTKMATNPPSLSETWVEMEKVLATGKVKVQPFCELICQRRSHLCCQRILVSLTFPSKRALGSRLVPKMLKTHLLESQAGADLEDRKSCPCCESSRVSILV